MKKRIVAIVVAVCILCSTLTPVCAAESENSNTLNRERYCLFMQNMYATTFAPNNRLYIATLDACTGLNDWIERASFLVGEDLSIERCTEILANMVTLMNYQLEDAIVKQASIDTTKTLMDYAGNLTDIAAGIVGTDTLQKSCDAVMKRITTAIGLTNGFREFTASTIEELEQLIQLEGDYMMQYDFLESVRLYSEIPEMREAAQSLISANKQIMAYKLEIITDVGDSFVKFEAHDVFLDQMVGELFKDPDFLDDETYALLVLKKFYDYYSLAKLAFDISMFFADTLLGMSDIYNRYNEMIAMRDIRTALLIRVEANPVLNASDDDNMERNISLMKMSLYADARGEYCVYKMITEDGKLLSHFSAGNQKSIEENYQISLNIIQHTFDTLDGLYDAGASSTGEKQVSSISLYKYGEKDQEYRFTYNDLGQVVGVAAYLYENGKAREWYSQQYEYDDHGNIKRVVHTARQAQEYYCYENDYDANGRLIAYRWDQYLDGMQYMSESYVLSYDEQGRVVERRDEYDSSVERFSYDVSGSVIYSTANIYRGDGHFDETTEYDHTFKPFVIIMRTSESKEYGNSSRKSISFKPIWNLNIVDCTIDDSYVFETDADGYLIKVTKKNGENVLVCSYE